MEPICKFENTEQLVEYLKYWQHVLHLDHWCIKAELVDKIESDEDGLAIEGFNQTSYENCQAYISICTADNNPVGKHCEELTLIHELLHCVFLATGNTEPAIQDVVYMTTEHQKVELMARAFIMARYGVDMKWFLKE